MARTPAHRRRKKPLDRAILAPRIGPPRCEACGKVTYPTERAATRAAAQLALKPKADAVVGRTYPCPRGNGWHVTSMTKGTEAS